MSQAFRFSVCFSKPTSTSGAMFSLVRSSLLQHSLVRIIRAAVHTTSTSTTERFRGTVKGPPAPDTDEGEKYQPEDYRQAAGYGVPKRGDDFFDRNKKLGRPLSPHLGIYQAQLPMLMSGTHRISGFMLALGLGVTSMGILVAPHNFDHYVEVVRSWHLNESFILLCKFSAAWLFSYHYLNGIRHLGWDAGQGFKLSQLYMSGYVVLGLSVLIAAYLAVQYRGAF